MSRSLSFQNNESLKEAAILVGSGVIYQDKRDYKKAKEKISEGIDKLKQKIVSDSTVDRENLLNYVT